MVKYEQLTDLMVDKGDYMTSSDDKSGFWQVPLHPSMWQYVAFQQACVTAITPVKSCCSYRWAVASSRPRARLLSEALITVMMSLGVVLNVPDPEGKKAQWLLSNSAGI